MKLFHRKWQASKKDYGMKNLDNYASETLIKSMTGNQSDRNYGKKKNRTQIM